VTSFFRSAASSSVSTVTFLTSLAFSSASSKSSPSTPRTVLPNIWISGGTSPREALVAGLLGQALHGLVGEADVQDGVHHAGHRELRPGTDRYEEGVVACRALVHRCFEGVEVCTHLVTQCRRLLATVEVVLHASVVIVKPGGTGRPRLVISARFAPLPPRRSLRSLFPSGEVVDELRYVGFLFSTRVSTPRGLDGCPDGQELTQIEGAWVRPLARHASVTTRPPADRKSKLGKRSPPDVFTS